MENEAPIQTVVAAFNDQQGAKDAFARLKEAEKEKVIAIKDAAILERDVDSKLHIRETKDMTGTRGAVLGGVAGAVIGVVTGPIGWAALGGAAVGGLVAKLRDSGFNNQRLEQWAANLTPGSSALVAVIEHKWVNQVEDILRESAREVLSLEVEEEIAEQLEAQKVKAPEPAVRS